MKYKMKRLAADGQINGTDEVELMGVLLTAGTDDASVEITEDADGSGTTVLLVKALAETTEYIDLTSIGGISLTQGYADLSGTDPEVVLFYE